MVLEYFVIVPPNGENFTIKAETFDFDSKLLCHVFYKCEKQNQIKYKAIAYIPITYAVIRSNSMVKKE